MKWGSKRRSIPEPVCWLAVLLVLHLVAVDGQLDDDEGFIEGLTVNGTKVALPVQGKPVTGRLRVLQHDLFAFRVLNKEAEGLGFPDVHLSLDVENEGANADIFCLPYAPENPDFRSPPGPRNAVWQSAHSTGIDNVLISTNSTFYRMGTNASFSQETDMKQTAAFICAVWGMSLVIANYRLELDLDYEKRSLVAKEESAVRSIFDKCCMKSGCRRWKRLGEFVVGTDPQGALPVLDLCHVIGNFCDGDGHLVSLSMRSYGLDCDFPLKEIGNFSRIENVDLSLNNLRASVGEVAGGLKVGGVGGLAKCYSASSFGSLLPSIISSKRMSVWAVQCFCMFGHKESCTLEVIGVKVAQHFHLLLCIVCLLLCARFGLLFCQIFLVIKDNRLQLSLVIGFPSLIFSAF